MSENFFRHSGLETGSHGHMFKALEILGLLLQDFNAYNLENVLIDFNTNHIS